MTSILNICDTCIHAIGLVGRTFVCDAFPDGVPLDILDGHDDHRTPHAGDGGIMWAAEDAHPDRPSFGVDNSVEDGVVEAPKTPLLDAETVRELLGYSAQEWALIADIDRADFRSLITRTVAERGVDYVREFRAFYREQYEFYKDF